MRKGTLPKAKASGNKNTALQPGILEKMSGRFFPDHSHALTDPNGLIACGGGLGDEILEEAYRNGIFPWFLDVEGANVCWWTPNPRMVLIPSDFHASRSLLRSKKRLAPKYRLDTSFMEVVERCATTGSRGRNGWLGAMMRDAYRRMHQNGTAHSFEVWSNKELVGGVLYVQFGAYVSGESMFSSVTDASKLALCEMCMRLGRDSDALIDCQLPSDHLKTLGATTMPRNVFLEAMKKAQRARKAELLMPLCPNHKD